MLELTISKEGGGEIILGIINHSIKYRINGKGVKDSVPLNEGRILLYSEDSEGKMDKKISMTPIVNYFPVIINQNHDGQYIPGKIIDIKKIN